VLTNEDIQAMALVVIEKFHPKQVYLFGSYAREEQSKDSDVDIMVVVDTVEDRLEMQTKIRMALIDFPVAQDIIVVSTQELERYSDYSGYICKSVLAEGRILYDRPKAA